MNFDIVLSLIVVYSMSKSTDMRECHLSRGASSASKILRTYIRAIKFCEKVGIVLVLGSEVW